MKNQPLPDYVSNDCVQTPPELAKRIVRHFKPVGKTLEPCRGDGNFLRYMPEASWCEIKEGRDFFEWKQKVDWVVTNPPWSQIRKFLQHAMIWSDNIVFLMTINHLWTKARIRDIGEFGFGIREICLLEMPKSFPQSGFQLGAIYLSRNWSNQITISNLSRLQKHPYLLSGGSHQKQ